MNDSNNFLQLSEAIKKSPVLFLSVSGVSIVFQCEVITLHENSIVLKNSIPYEYINAVKKSELFDLQLGSLRLQSTSIQSNGKDIIFPFNDISSIENTRKSSRFTFSPQENVACELVNPYDKKTILRKQLLDMSSSGLSLITFYESNLFTKDLKLNLTILIEGRLYSKREGTVVYSRIICDTKGRLKKHIGIKTA